MHDVVGDVHEQLRSKMRKSTKSARKVHDVVGDVHDKVHDKKVKKYGHELLRSNAPKVPFWSRTCWQDLSRKVT